MKPKNSEKKKEKNPPQTSHVILGPVCIQFQPPLAELFVAWVGLKQNFAVDENNHNFGI